MNFKEDRAESAETGLATQVVHHIIVFVVPPGSLSGNQTPVLSGTAPGDMPLILPAGEWPKRPWGSDLMFEMHYTPNGVRQDRSRADHFPKRPNMKSARCRSAIRHQDPPGDDNYKVEQLILYAEMLLLASCRHASARQRFS